MKLVSNHDYPTEGGDAVDAFKNERDYIAHSGRHKTTVAAMDWALGEIERLREKVEILEAEIRVMRRLPAAVNAAVDAVIAADGQTEKGR